jgi:hypothetical protein
MTKLLFSEYSLLYQMEMGELVRKVVKEKFIAGVKSGGQGEPAWIPADLLPAPKVESFDFSIYEGDENDLIWLNTSDDFGIYSVYVVIKDGKGKLIEKGEAYAWPDEPNRWGYLATACVPDGTTVTVQALVVDTLGGVGSRSERITVTEPIWRRPSVGNA